MAYIEVNYRDLRAMAAEIEEYLKIHDKKMGDAKTAVATMLTNDWIGTDAQSFQEKWDGMDTKGSISYVMRKNLEAYAKGLKTSAKAYQSAQESAHNRAALLIQW